MNEIEQMVEYSSQLKLGSFKYPREIKANDNIDTVPTDHTTGSNSHLLVCSSYSPPNSDVNWFV